MKPEPRNCCNGGKNPPPVHDYCGLRVIWPVYKRGRVEGWNRDRYNGIYRTRADSEYRGPWRVCQHPTVS